MLMPYLFVLCPPFLFVPYCLGFNHFQSRIVREGQIFMDWLCGGNIKGAVDLKSQLPFFIHNRRRKPIEVIKIGGV